MSDNDSSFGSFLGGLLLGAVVGAATALFLAPQSGQETRRRIATIGSDVRHAGEDQLEQLRATADQYSREYRDRAETFVAETRSRATHISDQAAQQARIVLDGGRDPAGDSADATPNGTQ